MNDDKLLNLLYKNPDKGIKVLTEQYAGLVYSVVKGKLCDFSFEEIEECMADTFSEFYLGIDNYKSDCGSIKSWLCVIARNNTIDILRKKQKQPIIISIDDENDIVKIEDDVSVEAEVENSYLINAVINEINKLGEPDSQIVIRKYYLNESSKEIAKALDMTVSNVDTRAHRAILKLRKRFGGDFV